MLQNRLAACIVMICYCGQSCARRVPDVLISIQLCKPGEPLTIRQGEMAIVPIHLASLDASRGATVSEFRVPCDCLLAIADGNGGGEPLRIAAGASAEAQLLVGVLSRRHHIPVSAFGPAGDLVGRLTIPIDCHLAVEWADSAIDVGYIPVGRHLAYSNQVVSGNVTALRIANPVDGVLSCDWSLRKSPDKAYADIILGVLREGAFRLQVIGVSSTGATAAFSITGIATNGLTNSQRVNFGLLRRGQRWSRRLRRQCQDARWSHDGVFRREVRGVMVVIENAGDSSSISVSVPDGASPGLVDSTLPLDILGVTQVRIVGVVL